MAGGPGGSEVGRISIRVVPNTERFRADLQRQLEVIEKELRATVQVDVDLNEAGVKAKFKALMTELKATAARDLKINVDVDSNGIGRSLANIGEGAGSTAGGLGGMSRGLGIVAAVAALAAPALALISGILVSLPAIISAVLVPIAAIALGLDGIKEAAKVLKPGFDALKATMSAKFQDVFTPIFQKLTGIFPTLQASMPGVATAIGTVAQSFVDVITSQSGLENIRGVIKNISDTIAGSAPGLGKMTDGLLGLANNVSSKFPAVSSWLDQVGDSFKNWVKSASTVDASGTSPLDRAMQNLGGTLKGVLDIIGDLAKAGFDFLQDPNFGQSMKDFVASTQTLIREVLPGLKTLFEQLAGYLKTTVDVLDKIDKWKPPDWAGITDKPKDTGVGGFPGVEPAPWKLDNGLTVIEDIKQAFATLGVEMSGIWTTMQVAAAAALANVQATINSVFSGIINVVAGAVGTIGTTLSSISGVISSVWSGLGGAASSAWSAVVSAVSSAISQVVSAVVSGGGQVVAEVSSWPGKISAALAGLAAAGAAAGAALVQGLINGIGSLIGAAVAKAKDLASQVANAAKSALGIHSPSTVFHEIGQNTAQGLENGITASTESVVASATALAQRISEALKNGIDPVDLKPLQDDLKAQMEQITLRSDRLKVDLNNAPDKDSKQPIKDQRTQLQNIRDQLKLQGDQLKTTDAYGDSLKENDSTMGDTLNKMITAGTGFATANMKQFQSDLGIGGGAITGGLDAGIGYATQLLGQAVSGAFGGGKGKTEIHVNSVDEAMAAYRTQQNKESLSYAGR